MRIDDQIRDEAAGWFAAMRRGPMALDERVAFDAWRAAPAHQQALNRMHELWGELAAIAPLAPAGAAAAVSPAARRRWAAAAALALMLAGGGGGLWLWARPDGEVVTAIGEQATATLPDGSVVTANVATRLAWDLEAGRRRVDMREGEAVFFVRKDRSRPFLVRAGGYEVRAVGTAFNVRNRGDAIDVAVIEGVVAVIAREGPRAGREIARIGAGRRLALGPARALTAAAAVQAAPVAAGEVAEWRVRTLDYEDAPIARVVEDLNLFFERPVALADPGLGRRRVTLRLQVSDRERALETLAALLDLRVESRAEADLLSSGA